MKAAIVTCEEIDTRVHSVHPGAARSAWQMRKSKPERHAVLKHEVYLPSSL